MVRFLVLVNTNAVIRFVRMFNPVSSDEKEFETQLKEIIETCLSHNNNKAPILTKTHGPPVVFKRFASLYFIAGVDSLESEFEILEFLDHIIEILDLYFEDVSELDIIRGLVRVNLLVEEIFSPDGEIIESDPEIILASLAKLD